MPHHPGTRCHLLATTLLLPLLVLLGFACVTAAEAPVPRKLFDPANSADSTKVGPSSKQVSTARSEDPKAPGLVVTVAPGPDGYPGINLKGPGESWDLAAFGRIEARLTNMGANKIGLGLRVDNAGDWRASPWNTENIYLNQGESGTLAVRFGYSFGRPAYALKAAAVTNLMVIATKAQAEQKFRVEWIQAAGQPGEKPPTPPDQVRTKPKQGVVWSAGEAIDLAKQINAHEANATLSGEAGRSALQLAFPAGKSGQSVTLKPAVGRWDFRDYLQVRVKARNTGTAPIAWRVRLESNAGPTDVVAAPAPLAPGAVQELVVSFIPATSMQIVSKNSTPPAWGTKPGTGTKFVSNAVSGVTFLADQAAGERTLRVEAITAEVPVPAKLPDWLGKRPPVEGDWVQTLSEEFDAPAIDQSVWNIYAANHWDPKSHFSKDNLVLGQGVVKLHFEKKTGFHNDNPKEKKTDYATGFLDSVGKWSQCYGYFEARLKLPKAPGLWSAFWLMPDRGESVPQWQRQGTHGGAMEFNVIEPISGWGPFRYNIAMHWDGYGKEHKATGSESIYAQPDKDGFLTCGLLWTPGSAIYYANGREVLRFEDLRVSSVVSILMFDLLSGGWDNDPLDDAKLPDDLTLDYVRVWQRKDLASPVDGKKVPAKTEAK